MTFARARPPTPAKASEPERQVARSDGAPSDAARTAALSLQPAVVDSSPARNAYFGRAVSRPDDPAERAADRNADDQAMRGMLGPGRPLHEKVRAEFESRFGHDFSGVRVHTGSSASAAAETRHAVAYT